MWTPGRDRIGSTRSGASASVRRRTAAEAGSDQADRCGARPNGIPASRKGTRKACKRSAGVVGSIPSMTTNSASLGAAARLGSGRAGNRIDGARSLRTVLRSSFIRSPRARDPASTRSDQTPQKRLKSVVSIGNEVYSSENRGAQGRMRPLAKASGTKMADRHEQKAARRRSHKRNPVFLDPLHRRARVIRIAASLSGLLLLVWLSTVAIGIYYIDILPENEKVALIRTGASDTDGVAARAPAPAPEACSGEPIDSAAALPQDGSMTRSAYLRVWPDRSLETRPGHCSGLDTILAEWIEIDPGSQTATWLSETGSDAALQDLKRASPTLGLELVALLPLPPAEPGDASVLDSPASRARIVSALSSKIGTGVYAGLCLYPRQAGPEHLPGLRALLREMTAALPSGVRSCLVTDAEGALWRDGRLVQAVDSVVLRAFREPRSDTRPGPLAPQAWFETLLEDAAAATGPEKLRVALGSFAVMWSGSAAEPTESACAEAMRLVARNDAVIGLDAASLNTRSRFVAEDGRAAELWFLDAASLHNQLKSLADRGVAGTVLWTVGLEDPGAWTLVARGAGPQIAAALETVSFPDYVGYEGTGPFRRVAQTAVTGERRFFRDPGTGLINGLVYDRVPRPVTVERYGHAPGKVIALTFDDGPDPDFTGAILDMLKANGVTATFFVIGSNVVQYPGIVRRMVAEGHEVGSHTF